jgi:hypothetical protein
LVDVPGIRWNRNKKKSSIKKVSFSKFLEIYFRYILVGWNYDIRKSALSGFEQQRDPFHPIGSCVSSSCILKCHLQKKGGNVELLRMNKISIKAAIATLFL